MGEGSKSSVREIEDALTDMLCGEEVQLTQPATLEHTTRWRTRWSLCSFIGEEKFVIEQFRLKANALRDTFDFYCELLLAGDPDKRRVRVKADHFDLFQGLREIVYSAMQDSEEWLKLGLTNVTRLDIEALRDTLAPASAQSHPETFGSW